MPKPVEKPSRPSSSKTSVVELTPKRIAGFDLARAFAIFGMVFVNFRLVMGGKSTTEWGEAFATMFDGRAAVLFVVLAGVGVSLMSREARLSTDAAVIASVRWSLLKRALLLFVVGLMYWPIWPPDILHYYGVYLIAAVCCLRCSDRQLLGFAAVAVGIATALLLTLNYENGWKDWESLEYVDFWTPVGMLRNTFFNGFHPFFPWVGFLLWGMWLGRQRLGEHKTCWRFFTIAVCVAIGAKLTSLGLIASLSSFPFSAEDAAALFGTDLMPPFPLYVVSAAATATAMICLCVRLAESCSDARWLTPFIHTGQLALSLYVAHVVIGMGALDAMGRLQSQSIPTVIAATIIFCVLATIASHVWRRRFDRGPLEAVFRKLSG